MTTYVESLFHVSVKFEIQMFLGFENICIAWEVT